MAKLKTEKTVGLGFASVSEKKGIWQFLWLDLVYIYVHVYTFFMKSMQYG